MNISIPPFLMRFIIFNLTTFRPEIVFDKTFSEYIIIHSSSTIWVQNIFSNDSIWNVVSKHQFDYENTQQGSNCKRTIWLALHRLHESYWLYVVSPFRSWPVIFKVFRWVFVSVRREVNHTPTDYASSAPVVGIWKQNPILLIPTLTLYSVCVVRVEPVVNNVMLYVLPHV